jgi:hypothetical protein
MVTGLGANLLDTLGISSLATTTAVFELSRRVSDETIPGTLRSDESRCWPLRTMLDS